MLLRDKSVYEVPIDLLKKWLIREWKKKKTSSLHLLNNFDPGKKTRKLEILIQWKEIDGKVMK